MNHRPWGALAGALVAAAALAQAPAQPRPPDTNQQMQSGTLQLRPGELLGQPEAERPARPGQARRPPARLPHRASGGGI